MIIPAKKVEVDVSVFLRPTGRMVVVATAPQIDAFETIRLSEPRPDLWIQWIKPRQPSDAFARLAFVTRQGPLESATKSKVIAYSARLDCFGRNAFDLAVMHKLLGAQKVVDLWVSEVRVPEDGDYWNSVVANGIHLFAFTEGPNYLWTRYQALCQQLALEMRDRRRRQPPEPMHQGDGCLGLAAPGALGDCRVSYAAMLPLRRL